MRFLEQIPNASSYNCQINFYSKIRFKVYNLYEKCSERQFII